jgi:prophage maintenance system killer protein
MSEQETQQLIQQLLPTLITLEQFDKGSIQIKPKVEEKQKLALEKCKQIIFDTKQSLKEQNQETGFFGLDNGENLKSILGNLYATFGGIELYPSFEDKAANLLYLIIKDHPFVDGNKRIASLLFNFYAQINGKNIYIIPSLPLQIAQSRPEDKALIIDLIISLLQQN